MYLNGVEVFRENLPTGPIDFRTLALNVVEPQNLTAILATNLLQPGPNVVAVEMHQVTPVSSDLEFDLSLATVSDSRVGIIATDSSAAEAGGDPATFTVTRTGSTNVATIVFYQVSGSASNGLDYANLSGQVGIPAGATQATITVSPFDDDLQETNETVIITLLTPGCAAIQPLPDGCYFLATNFSATAQILNNASPNHSPTVSMAQPVEGARFIDPTNILLRAVTQDTNGLGTRRSVAFYARGVLLGQATNSIAGSPGVYEFVWRRVRSGSYDLSTIATDGPGLRGTSAPVRIQVVSESGYCAPPVAWQTSVGDTFSNALRRVHPTADGGFLLAGGTQAGTERFWLARLAADGSLLWQFTYGTNAADRFGDAQPSTSGLFLAGTAQRTNGVPASADAEIISVDEQGAVLWSATYGGGALDAFYSVVGTPDGGGLAAGESASAPGANKTTALYGKSDVWIVKFDATGQKKDRKSVV